MGWLKRAASSVKNAMGFGDDSDDEAYGENGEKNNSSRRRSNHGGSSSSKSKQKVLRYPVLQFAQSPITGEFIGGVQGLSWFCEEFRENGEGPIVMPHRGKDAVTNNTTKVNTDDDGKKSDDKKKEN